MERPDEVSRVNLEFKKGGCLADPNLATAVMSFLVGRKEAKSTPDYLGLSNIQFNLRCLPGHTVNF